MRKADSEAAGRGQIVVWRTFWASFCPLPLRCCYPLTPDLPPLARATPSGDGGPPRSRGLQGELKKHHLGFGKADRQPICAINIEWNAR